MFHINMYNNPESTKTLNKELCNLYRKIEAASPTQWHLVMERIAKEKRLQRLYTQNIDGIDTDLELLKTMIPLPKKDWPKTIQLHGNLRTVRCQADDRHLIPFDPADFPGNSASRGLPCCTECEKNKQLKAIPVMRPRIWLYDDRDYPDRDAIESVKVADLRAKPDAVIVVGTALKVKYAKNLARDMCGAVRKGGFTAWINRKAPPSDLNCFDLVVEGDCDAVAWHASSWWLEEGILSKFQVQRLEEKCNLFIAKSPEEALERSLVLVDSDFRAKALQRYQSTPRGVKFKESGKTATVLAESSQRPGSSASKVVNHNVETVSKPREIPLPTWISVPSDSSDALPKLPDCWEREMSQRLSEVEVRQIESSRKSTSVVTKIPSLGYREVNIANSLWHLKPGEELNDEVVNAYLELLQRSTVSVDQAIEGTGILYLKPGRQWKTFDKLSKVRTYSIFIPIHIPGHWCFAVLTPGENNILCLEYYDSASGGPPQALRDWIHGRFPDREVEITQGSPNPRQRNGVDCGLFVLLGIRLLSASRRHLSQAQSDSIIPTFRQRVLAELLAGSLNPSSSQFEEFQRMEAHAHTILPRLEKAGDEDHQVGSPDSSVLFMSPPPVPDPMEYAETNSSAVLDESEEELVQVKPSKQKTSRGKSPVQIASTFADEASIVKMLREAISIERTLHKGSKNTKIESMQLSDLWCMISTEKRALKQRHIHYEFSRQFWAEMGNFNRSPHQRGPVPELAIFTVMSKLGICNRISWNYILQRARRASIWTELAEIFKDDVEHPSVVLCAIPEATTALETMTMANRKELIEKIHSRRNEPGNGILARLKAAADLYRAVILGDLPKDLPIESADNGLPFEQVVSSKSKTEALAQTTPFPTSISNSSESGAAHRLTPDRLRDYDDYATDILIDNVGLPRLKRPELTYILTALSDAPGSEESRSIFADYRESTRYT
jgi:NAD-dependent histone deacetylase SIR2